jgi:hypothetical protein
MHPCSDLVETCIAFNLDALARAERDVLDKLQASGATRLVAALQMIRLQKAIMAVGLFAMFDASLQTRLGCPDGFRAAGERLERLREVALRQRFLDFQSAINVLKHGRGTSYDRLVTNAGMLPFRIRRPDEHFFDEGDVSEPDNLIDVDDAFVKSCASVIREVSDAILRSA